MTELENIKSLEKYDAWKKAKRSHDNWISLIAGAIGMILGALLTLLILKVSPSDIWTLGKGAFISEEKILEQKPAIDKIDDKIKASIAGGAMKWISKKLEEEGAKEILRGNLKGAVRNFRVYCIAIIAIWLIVFGIITGIFGWLIGWIIVKYWWPKPTLIETFIKENKKEISL